MKKDIIVDTDDDNMNKSAINYDDFDCDLERDSESDNDLFCRMFRTK